MDFLLAPIIFATKLSCFRVSIHQFYKNFFICLKMLIMQCNAMQNKKQKKTKKNKFDIR